MRRGVVMLVGILSLGVTGAAAAEPCPQSIGVRVNEPGLRFIGAIVKKLIPTEIEIPAINRTVIDWPLTSSDAVVNIPKTKVFLNVYQLSLGMAGAAVRARVSLDVAGSGPVAVDNPYAGLGSASCLGNVDVRALSIDVAVSLQTTPAGVVAVVDFFRVDLDNDASTIALEGCFLGDALTLVSDFVRRHFMGAIQSRVEKLAKERIPELIGQKLQETASISKELPGFTVTASLGELVTDQAGVVVALGLGVEPKAGASQCTSLLPAAEPGCGAPLPAFGGNSSAMFAVAVTGGVINRALHAVWRAGMMCIDSATLEQPTVAEGLTKVGGLLGLPIDTRLSVAMQLVEPPSVSITPLAGLWLSVPAMRVQMQMNHADGSSESACMSAAFSVSAAPWVEPQDNTIALDLHQVLLENVQLQSCDGGSSESNIVLDPARLQRFIARVGLPMLRQRLDQTRLSPSVIGVQGYAVELKSVQMEEGYLVAHVDAHDASPTGNTTPETLSRGEVPVVVGPQLLQINVGGRDDLTDDVLLRYQVRVNGGQWSLPSYGGRVDVAISPDVTLIEIAAVDQDGNVDPTPLAIPIVVDDAPPEISILSRPESMLGQGVARVEFAASDDRSSESELTYQATLLRVPDGGGVAQVIEERPLAGRQREVTFEQLGGGVYKIRIMVSDQVGNVTSRDIGFVVEDGGCTVGNNALGSRLWLPLLLGLCALAWRRRRRLR